MPARTTEPTLNAGARSDPFTGGDRIGSNLYSGAATNLDADDIVVAGFHISGLLGNVLPVTLSCGSRNSGGSLTNDWGAPLVRWDEARDTFDISYAVWAGPARSNGAQSLYVNSNNGTGGFAHYCNFAGETVDGDVTLVDSGTFNETADWTYTPNTVLTFPAHEVPTGYKFLYCISAHSDFASGTLAGWTGATAMLNSSTTLGYDFEHWVGVRSAGASATVSMTTSNSLNSHFSNNNWPIFGAILAVPGT